MTYHKMSKEAGALPVLITKAEAKRILDGWWKDDFLNDIFDNDKQFRLFTAFSVVWTNDGGLVPAAGFYGVVGE